MPHPPVGDIAIDRCIMDILEVHVQSWTTSTDWTLLQLISWCTVYIYCSEVHAQDVIILNGHTNLISVDSQL